MEILNPTAYYEALKRYWRRRKYQRLPNNNRRNKLKVMRLGGSNRSSRRQYMRIRTAPKLKWRIVSPFSSPVKLIAKFHDAYIDAMIRFACSAVKPTKGDVRGIFRGKPVAGTRQIATVSTGDEVDGRFVVEVYKKLAASRQLHGDVLEL